MARKSPSRQELRKQAEAAEKADDGAPKRKKAKKKAKKKKTTRTKRSKEKALGRRRLVWAVLSGNLKEEARFPYEERDKAEAKIEQLRAKSTKKMYFIQPIKEPIPETPASEEDKES